MIKIGVLGGDRREEILTDILSKRDINLKVLHHSTSSDNDKVTYVNDLRSVVQGVDVVLAPMSGIDEEGNLRTTFIDKQINLNQGLFKLFEKDTLFMIGSIRPFIKEILEEQGIRYIELAKLDELAILNAIPTAEGAIQYAMKKSPLTIFDSKILVTGLGRVGLGLAWRLKALGARVFAATRDSAATARGMDLGITMISYSELESKLNQFDFIFNTVPALIFNERYLSKLQKEVLLIDLASSPGGVDFQKADELGINAHLLPGLPGKVAPLTAARILSEVIIKNIEDKGGIKDGTKE